MSRIRILILVTCLATLPLVGCQSDAAASLDGTSWTLIALNGEAPLAGAEVTLQFDGDQISGSTGCNHYFGTYEVGRKQLTFGGVGMTERACLQPEGIMQQEYIYGTLLSQAERYEHVDGQLRIHCADGATLIYATAAE